MPLTLSLIVLSTRFVTHPAALDVFDLSWQIVADWTPHIGHANPNPPPAESTTTTVGSATLMGTALSLASSSTAAPTVTAGCATVPTGAPDLSKPFPQPFDDTFPTNHPTMGCQDLMSNMTQTAACRECRPFLLLVQDEDAFITVSLFDLRAPPLAGPLPFHIFTRSRLFSLFAVYDLNICDHGFEP